MPRPTRWPKVGPAVDFVREQFRHCKAMLVLGDAPALLAAAGIAAPSDAGVLRVAAGADASDAFVKAIGRHKHYEREQDPSPV